MEDTIDIQIDARGVTCPAPVLKTRELIEAESPQKIEILVDNQAARENVTRFLHSQGYDVADSPQKSPDGDIFRLLGSKKEGAGEATGRADSVKSEISSTEENRESLEKLAMVARLIARNRKSTGSRKESGEEKKKIVVLIMTDKIGSGDDELGRMLMVNYIKTLTELGGELWQLILVNGGVRLACKSSPVLDALKQYEADGTIILSCGTCMEHFGLTAEKGVGGLTNMLDIVMAQQNADKVITLG